MPRCKLNRRLLLLVAACAVVLPSGAAARYPEKPVRMLVGYPPGGGADFVARLISVELSKLLGQQIVVDNRPGAEGALAAQLVARSARDGYTLLLVPFNMALSPSLRKDLPYDALKDFQAVTLIASAPMALTVNPSLAAKSVSDLIALAKSRPGSIKYASSGTGGTSHVSAELFKSLAKVNLAHIPYRGSGPALLATISGEVNVCFGSLPPILTHRKSGALNVLGVTTKKRSRVAPDIPTIAESVPGYDFATWYGIVAPAHTPRTVVELLHGELVKVLAMDQVQSRLLNDGAEPVGSRPDEFQRFFASEIAKWGGIIRNAGITPE